MSDATKKWLNEDEQELCAVLICRSDAESARTLDLVARLCSRLDAQQAEADETQQTFDMMWDADQRAIKAWQAETGEDMVWPDRKVLTRWLLDKIDAQQEVIGKLAAIAADSPPESWEPYDSWGEPNGYGSIGDGDRVDGVDTTNGGDMHNHGVAVGAWEQANRIRTIIAASARKEQP